MDFVDFEVEGIGKFKAQIEITIQQGFELEREVDQFFEGNLAEMQARANKLGEIAKVNLLAHHFSGKLLGDLTPDERDKFNKLWLADDSVEAQAAEAMNFRINQVRMAFRLDKMLLERPEGIGHIGDLTDYGLFMRIWTAYGAALAPFRATGSEDSEGLKSEPGRTEKDPDLATQG